MICYRFHIAYFYIRRIMKANQFKLFLYPLILLTFCCQAQPGITFDFENWNTDQSLPGWTLSPVGAEKTDTAYLGNHAIRVWNWYYYSKGYFYNDTDNNYLPLSNIFPFHRGQAITFAPVSVSGYYRYLAGDNNGSNDSAWIRITLTKFNSQTMQSDSIGSGIIKLGFSSQYIPFQFPINYYSQDIPDTFLLSVVSSLNGFCNTASSGECLYLSVDHLSLSTQTGIKLPIERTGISLIDAHTLSIQESPGSLLNIYDISGRIWRQEYLSGDIKTINLRDLNPGIYFATLLHAQKTKTFTFSINKP